MDRRKAGQSHARKVHSGEDFNYIKKNETHNQSMNLNVHCFRLLRCHKERNFLIKLKAKATAIRARQPPIPIPLLQITFRHYGQRPHTHITHIICSICIMPPLGFNRRICGTSRRRRRLTHFADISEEFALLRDKMAP